MADFTSNLFLAIHARDLTGPGLIGASTHLRTFGAIGAVALGGIVVASLKAASNFQSMTQSIANNTTMGQGGLDRMRASILRLGNDSNVPLDQLGQGYMRATNLGYDARDATQILTAAMKSAASTNSNTADTTNTLASVMHEFNLQGAAAAKTMDILHLASAQGNTTLEQFTTGGNKAIAMAANLGVPLNQVTAALSAMTRHGSIENASTTIVGALSKIVNPAKAAQKELASLTLKTGIDLLGDFTPAGLKAKGLTGILADLKAATNGNAQEIFKLIPALRGGQAAMILTGNGAKDYSGILASLNGVTAKSGITARAYAATQKTASFQFGELRNKVQILAITLGTQLLPYATAAASWLGAHLPQAVALLTPRLTVLIANGLAVGRAFVAAVGAMTRLASGLKGLVAPLLATATHLGATRQGAAQLGAGLALLIPAIVAIKVGMIAWRVAEVGVQVALVAGRAAALAWRGAVLLAQGAMLLWRGAVVAATVVTATYTAANEALSLAYVALRLGVISSTAATIGNKIATIELQASYVSQRVITIATTAATWLWTTALDASRMAVLAVGIAGWKGVAAMTAQAVAGLAVRAATALWTGAQWLLNAALYANPIGLVIAAVAALVVGVVWAYKNVGWFHDAVNKAWTFLSAVFAPGLGTVAGALKNVLGAAISWVTDKIKGLIGFFGNLLHMVSSIPGVKAVIGAAYTAAGGTGSASHSHGATTSHPATRGVGVGVLASRLGVRGNDTTTLAHHQQVLGYHAAGAAPHGLNAAQRAAQAYLAGKAKARTPEQAAQLGLRTDTALWKQGRRADAQIARDIAILAKLDPKKAALLQAQFDAQVHRRNDAIRHHAAAQQVRIAHHNAAIAHHGAVVQHHAEVMAAHHAAAAQRKALHTETVNLRAQYQNDNTQFATDMRDKNYSAARTMIAALTTLKRTMEIRAGVSAGQATKDAATYSDSLLSKLDAKTGIVAGLKKLTAHAMGSGFHRSVYGYTSRQQVGQGVGLGQTLVTFGGRVGKDPAQQMIEKLDAQVQQLTRQNAALTALLSVAEEGVTATLSVRDAIKGAARAIPGAGIGNPLRVQGLATAVR